jgi:hypothetical protein
MSAGSWLTSAGFGDALASVILLGYTEAINDERYNSSIVLHPVFQGVLARDQGMPLPPGALAGRLSVAAFGTGKAAATSEGSAASATNFSTTNYSVTPARRQFARTASDFASALTEGVPMDLGLTVPAGSQDLGENATAALVMIGEGQRIWSNTLVDLVCGLLTSLSLSVGTSGAALTWDDLSTIAIKLRGAGAAGPYIGLISERQALDLMADTSSVSGAQVNAAVLTEFFAKGGGDGGYLFTFGGVDYHLCAELDVSGDDVIGGVLSADAFATIHKRVAAQVQSSGLNITSNAYSVQVVQGAGTGVTTCYTTTHCGVALVQAAAGCKIVTRATA